MLLGLLAALVAYQPEEKPDETTEMAGPTSVPLVLQSTTTTTTSATTTTQATVAVTTTLLEIEIPTIPEIVCAWIDTVEGDRYLDRVRDIDHCLPIARARLAIQNIDNPRWLNVPAFTFDQFSKDVLHMMYIDSLESAGNVLANGQNWGCPRQEILAAFHPDPDGVGPITGRANCPYYQNRVPTGNLSHMAHLVCERSQRFLNVDCINPYDLEEAALLGFALVYETGRNGWYHWWHIHWGLNRYLTPHGIQGVYHCPEPGYWALVRGGRQECPYG